ncbi:MAG: 2-polyprenylphenol 6-hydroxylase [Geminicoccaceae bacterium]|nr:2-polyprenylphenol 6-hydroxylase [Geminicoccaceae bacterium]MCB9944875.1 2-polyprenylphenol 6-hydroxylase [Geminicoccaceae bacterium]
MLRSIRNLLRLTRIARILARNDALFPLEMIPAAAPLLKLTSPLINRKATGRPGERLARSLQQLGPCFIKFGQSLATRADLIGDPIARDLASLQDRLPSFPPAMARATVEREMEAPLDSLFLEFDDTPVAAASIAQVHLARTSEGTEVAVKILRPGIEQAIERDLDLLLWTAALVERLQNQFRRYRILEAVQIFAASTRRELDLRLEAAAAAELHENCIHDQGFRVPAVDWQRTARRVATFERVRGLRVDEPEKLVEAGLHPDAILERAAAVFFNQVFRDGFFHGDMHPGNMLIDEHGVIVALDFGIMGRVDLATRRHLAAILVGFLRRDYASVSDVFFDAGFLPDTQDRLSFTQACRAIGEPILDKPLSDISFGRVLGQVLAIAEQFDMQTQPQLLLLQKTMVVAEGVGRYLNPRVNMWELAHPLVEDWIRRHLGPQAQLENIARDGMKLARNLPSMMQRLDRALERMEDRGPPSRPAGEAWKWALAGTIGLIIGLLIK